MKRRFSTKCWIQKLFKSTPRQKNMVQNINCFKIIWTNCFVISLKPKIWPQNCRRWAPGGQAALSGGERPGDPLKIPSCWKRLQEILESKKLLVIVVRDCLPFFGIKKPWENEDVLLSPFSKKWDGDETCSFLKCHFFAGDHLVKTKALDFLKDNDLVHRDVKPGNLLFAEQEVVKLSDFGCATLAPDSLLLEEKKCQPTAGWRICWWILPAWWWKKSYMLCFEILLPYENWQHGFKWQ